MKWCMRIALMALMLGVGLPSVGQPRDGLVGKAKMPNWRQLGLRPQPDWALAAPIEIKSYSESSVIISVDVDKTCRRHDPRWKSSDYPECAIVITFALKQTVRGRPRPVTRVYFNTTLAALAGIVDLDFWPSACRSPGCTGDCRRENCSLKNVEIKRVEVYSNIPR